MAQELELDAGQPFVTAEMGDPYTGKRFVDYTLRIRDEHVAVIEAKKTSKDAEIGREQALQYAQLIEKNLHSPEPLIFYTNGHEIHFWEHGVYPPALVHGFPSKDDLNWMAVRAKERAPLSAELVNPAIAGRPYQIAAIRSVLEAFESKRRMALVVMATGTGKTRTAAALVDVLMRARWARRVLFLVDRLALQEQALDAFKEHLPNEPTWPQQGEKTFASDRRIYCTTYQTLLGIVRHENPDQPWVSPFFFDLVILDESHRSLYNIYGEVLDYFHALKLGLTATPKDQIDADTFKLFGRDRHDPTFAFTYEEALASQPPYLCPFEVLDLQTQFQKTGIKADELDLPLQELLQREGKDLEEIDFEGTDLERKVANAGTNAVIVREFMESSIKDPSGTLPGKTIIFAVSKDHAYRLEALFNELYPQHAGELARVLVSQDPRVHGKGGLLDQFKKLDMPRVAISVDMLDTGVDVPELVNLVFAKPVYSFVKFWQMIGRGTRLLPAKLRPWCVTKDKFLILDCWGNFKFFNQNPKGYEPLAQVPLPVRLFRLRLSRLQAAQVAGDSALVQRIIAELQGDMAELPSEGAIVGDARANLEKVRDKGFWLNLSQPKIDFLSQDIAPVLRARSKADMRALSLQADVQALGAALLRGESADASKAILSIRRKAGALPLSVNVVREKEEWVLAPQRDDFWQAVTQEQLDDLATHLGPLMRYRRSDQPDMQLLDLPDVTASLEHLEVMPGLDGVQVKEYRNRVEALVRTIEESNPVLHKIKQGGRPTDEELKSLSVFLQSQSMAVTVDSLRKAYVDRQAGLVRLLRYALGTEQPGTWDAKVAEAFEAFVQAHAFGSAQLQFLETLKAYVLNHHKVVRENLVEAPFTQLHPQGVLGLFRGLEIEEIVEFSENLVA